jgi:hypothetical protein
MLYPHLLIIIEINSFRWMNSKDSLRLKLTNAGKAKDKF